MRNVETRITETGPEQRTASDRQWVPIETEEERARRRAGGSHAEGKSIAQTQTGVRLISRRVVGWPVGGPLVEAERKPILGKPVLCGIYSDEIDARHRMGQLGYTGRKFFIE